MENTFEGNWGRQSSFNDTLLKKKKIKKEISIWNWNWIYLIFTLQKLHFKWMLSGKCSAQNKILNTIQLHIISAELNWKWKWQRFLFIFKLQN